MIDKLLLLINWLIEHLELLAAALIVLASLGSIYKFFIKARLKIVFDPNETYHERIVENDQRAMFLHLIVKNNGFITARGCQSYLVKVAKLEEKTDEFIPDKRFPAQMVLKWAHEKDFLSRPILSRDNRRMDLVFAYPNDQNLYIFTEHFPRGSNTFFTLGTYLLKIVVISDNAKEVSGMFKLIWDGDWKDIRIKKLNYFDRTKSFINLGIRKPN